MKWIMYICVSTCVYVYLRIFVKCCEQCNSYLFYINAVFEHAEENPQVDDESHYNAKYDRCEGIEFDAIAPDKKGTALFFKGLYSAFNNIHCRRGVLV